MGRSSRVESLMRQKDVLYEEPERVLAEYMVHGRKPSVVSHDTSGRDRVGSEAKLVVELMSTPTRRAVMKDSTN